MKNYRELLAKDIFERFRKEYEEELDLELLLRTLESVEMTVSTGDVSKLIITNISDKLDADENYLNSLSLCLVYKNQTNVTQWRERIEKKYQSKKEMTMWLSKLHSHLV